MIDFEVRKFTIVFRKLKELGMQRMSMLGMRKQQLRMLQLEQRMQRIRSMIHTRPF